MDNFLAGCEACEWHRDWWDDGLQIGKPESEATSQATDSSLTEPSQLAGPDQEKRRGEGTEMMTQ